MRLISRMIVGTQNYSIETFTSIVFMYLLISDLVQKKRYDRISLLFNWGLHHLIKVYYDLMNSYHQPCVVNFMEVGITMKITETLSRISCGYWPLMFEGKLMLLRNSAWLFMWDSVFCLLFTHAKSRDKAVQTGDGKFNC